MAAVANDFAVVESVLCDVAGLFKTNDPIRTLLAFDRDRGQFLVMTEGWRRYERIHSVIIHVEVAGETVRIHKDGTEIGIADLLAEKGIPKDRIVLAFHAPSIRAIGEFAVA